jgi:acyl carrier protein
VPTARLVADFQADLMRLTQLALALEDALEIEIVDADWIDVTTVAEVIGYVTGRLQESVDETRPERSDT